MYIKKKKEQLIMTDKIQSVRKAKDLLKEILRVNKLSEKVENYRDMK